jgi:predicted dehydrogenase
MLAYQRCCTLGVFYALLAILFVPCHAQESKSAPLRAGMIGLDTSHVPAFTKIFNAAEASGNLAGIQIVAGYPGGTDFPASRDRVQKFTETMASMGVEIVDSIAELLEKVDVVFLESVDGRIHLEQAIPVIKAGKPMFIDKPLAGSLVDAMAIYELAKSHNVPYFSSSSYRFSPGIVALLNNPQVGSIAGAASWGPCSYQEGTMDMAFYGIHGIEALYTLMGEGCETVARIKTEDTDLISGVWKGGRVGTYRGIRKNNSEAGAVVFGSKSIVKAEKGGSYADLCQEIGKFFRTHEPPVAPQVTIEMFAFMEAADESLRRGGEPVSIAEVMAKAQPLVKKRLSTVSK